MLKPEMEASLQTARNLVLEYSQLVREQDMEAILATLSHEISLQIPDYPPLTGKEELKLFYEQRFNQAEYTFELNISDEKIVSDLYFINGIMHRTTIEASDRSTEALDFSFILRHEDGNLKIWQMRLV